MKSRFFLILILLLSLCLAACGEAPDSSGTDNSTDPNHVHVFGEWTVSQKPTCEDKGVKTRSCACGEEETGTVNALGHSFGGWTTVEEPTCTKLGKRTRSCGCGAEETEKLKPNGHDYVEVEKVYPTPSNANGSVKYNCSVCGATHEEQMEISGSKGLEYKVITPEIADIPQADGTTCMIMSIGTCTDSALVIPQYIDGYKVLAIGQNAFLDCVSITSVVIPDGVLYIGEAAFKSCLELKSVTLPGSVTVIDDDAFHWCWNLSDITIPEGVQTIGVRAFRGCDMSELVLPDSVVSVGFSAFASCNFLTNVTLSGNMTRIEDDMFLGCSGLTSITIPEGVQSIGYSAFYDCRALTSVTIAGSVKEIDVGAFAGCSQLKQIHYAGTMAQWNAVAKSDGGWAGDPWDKETGYYTVYCTDGEIKK